MKYILKSPRRVGVILIDMVIFAVCYYLAFFLRFEHWNLPGYAGMFWSTMPMAVVIQSAGMLFAGVYRGLWRYASINDLVNIVKGMTLGTGATIAGVLFYASGHGFPRSIFIINAGLVILGIGGARFARRIIIEMHFLTNGKAAGKTVLIVGAGNAAEQLIREIKHNPRLNYTPVGIVDDEAGKYGQELHGVKVLGTIDDLPKIARDEEAEEILIAIPSATGPDMRRIVEMCRETGVPYRTVPGTGDIIGGRVHIRHLRKVKMEDLLRRPSVKMDRQAIRGYINGKKVLVTGAGGSIGSELCRQAARFGPAEIIFLDHSENSLFYMDEEFSRVFPGMKYSLVVADITNKARITQVMKVWKPDVVFHAAAHKHVPLMEENLCAAFTNNVTGTRVMAEAAAASGVGKFVQISTDKAVNPSNIMGISKRIAEMVVQGINHVAVSGTEFVSVRFGNVMGSEGSVIPLFTRQIEAGGPVTVTDPKVTRYFMTIPEAVQLVLQAAAMGRGGEIFILDMGDPIKIADLARDMITLSGLEPDVDIGIKFTGLRPGEKLYEELITEGEGIMPTEHEKIMVLHSDAHNHTREMMKKIRKLEDIVARCDGPREIMALARELVPEYRPMGSGLHS